MRSTADAGDADRDRVELIWFPTGGGKTEAYLGLSAYTMGLRRLQGVVAGRVGDEGVAFDPTVHEAVLHEPAGPGEEIVSACGCLDDFPEAVVMMQTVRLAGADMTCTSVVP